jgi:hypothetical protein
MHATGYLGDSHQCICLTWKYTQRRAEAINFPLGDWHKDLVTREFKRPMRQKRFG